MFHRPYRALFLLGLGVIAAASCTEEEYPAALWAEQHPAPLPDGGVATSAGPQGPIACTQSRAQSLPARLVALSGKTAASGENSTVFVSNIFQEQFVPICGGCHTSQSFGGFHISDATDFATLMTPAVLAHVTHAVCTGTAGNPDPSNPFDPMPPCGATEGTYAQRPANDPIVGFAKVVQQWIGAGSPPDSFTPDAGAGGGDAGGDGGSNVGPYALSPAVGNGMTNIGNCIPATLAPVADAKAAALDKMFANLKADPTANGPAALGLPATLSETDLFTLDSAVLANYGVVAYAPGYPLWSDNAGKLRYVRVPYGTSIHFNKATQEFDIPPNTRFYKTFTKPIIDTDGSLRYRKIETRLIVARPDVNNANGSAKTQTALFGTYQWCAGGTNVLCAPGQPDESEAYLVTQPLKSETPFADTLLVYNTDEPLAADILKGNPAGGETALLQTNIVAGHPAARHYAIPSSQRCMQCHMGSPTQSFNLGFTPLQINRRPTGSGGNIEETGPDELTQLQRFIDYGLVTGIDSLSDVLPLEKSQGTRLPRNNYELVAQGYVMGNCQHCHNPRGFPTVEDPGLTNLLDFLPSAQGGGIFQFPLERYSPALGRGLTGSELVPYITPSLVDLPRVVSTPGTVPIGAPDRDIFVNGGSASTPPDSVVYAPWRSLIYRNVDAAFAYTDDVALFPHMPFNTPGYDPRAKQILGDWMVSIPSVRKHPEIPEYAFQGTTTVNGPGDVTPLIIGGTLVDSTPQPYAEIPPGAPGYDEAVAAATQGPASRLSVFHSGVNPAFPIAPLDQGGLIYSRYADPGVTDDIEDPNVLADPTCHPIPVGNPVGTTNAYPFPNHPHWVITDTSQPPPPWQPRNPTWVDVLVKGNIPAPPQGCGLSGGTLGAYDDQVAAVSLLQDATLEQVSAFVTKPIPLGLWKPPTPQPNPACDYSSQKTVKSFTGAAGTANARPNWMDFSNPQATPPIVAPSPDAFVYSETPGAGVFKMICINCHGPNADANGRLAANLATMTGGAAQVADFRDGLFGPVSAPDHNIESVFGTTPLLADLASLVSDAGADAADGGGQAVEVDAAAYTSTALTADDRAARYMPWMALGGTQVTIPVPILQIVAVTQVFGSQRVLSSSNLSGNMLSQAKALCLSLLGPTQTYFDGTKSTQMVPGVPEAGDPTRSLTGGYLDPSGYLNQTLLPQNGDAELWLTLCSTANPSPVHVVRPGQSFAAAATPTNTSIPRSGAYNDALGVAPGVSDVGGSLLFDPYPGANGQGEESDYALVDSALYPPGTPVGNEYGLSVTPSNGGAGSDWPAWPWCVDPTYVTPDTASSPTTTTVPASWQVTWMNGNPFPVCPPIIQQVSQGCSSKPFAPPSLPPGLPAGTTCYGNDAANKWAVRGAINAGMAVFLYVQSIEKSGPAPDYDECPAK